MACFSQAAMSAWLPEGSGGLRVDLRAGAFLDTVRLLHRSCAAKIASCAWTRGRALFGRPHRVGRRRLRLRLQAQLLHRVHVLDIEVEEREREGQYQQSDHPG